jgi:cytidylate kinase
MNAPVIAIDGPSASGKGTVAQCVAQALGFHYLESGALYRLVALVSLEAGVAPDDADGLRRIAETLDARFADGTITLGGAKVDPARLYEERCAARASQVAPYPGVRNALLTRQRAFRRAPGLVADGRDMGTVVFPDAELKVFLTASPEERARRRHNQLKQKGINANLRALSRDLAARDARDSARNVAPLFRAADARELECSTLTVDAVVATVLDWWQEGRSSVSV